MLAEVTQAGMQMSKAIEAMREKRVLIVGLGKTGLSCARYLATHQIEVAVTDTRDHPPGLDELQHELPDLAVFVGGFASEAFSRADILVVSPGISVRTPLIAEARARGAEVIGDIELFARNVNAPVVAITGSNGKSTVTSLLGEMAKSAGIDVRVGGNIGTPALDLLHEPVPQLYVLELSSFQLETTNSLNAAAAAILNISEDHMDRYDDLRDYAAAKAKIYLGSGTLVVNWDDARVNATVQMMGKGREVVGFSLQEPAGNDFGLCQKNAQHWLCTAQQMLLPVDEMRIKGMHNVANALAALALGRAVGIAMEPMLETLKSYPGLPHRSQWVAEIDQVNWFNDSKATNVGAAIAAINGIPGNQLVLLAGGQGKGQDFTLLRDALSQRVRTVILFGQDADIIEKAIKGCVAIVRVKDMQEAVITARDIAQPGDAVLLSPACASFDMYNGYDHRGNDFASKVRGLLP